MRRIMETILRHCVRSILALAGVAVACALMMLGCGSEPGRQEFDSGLSEFQAGNYPRAQVMFEKSINRRPADPANALAYNYLGIIEMRLGKLQRAVQDFQESRRLRADLFDPAYNLAAVYWELGSRAEARRLFEEASMLDMKDTRALSFLARTYLQEKQYEEARRILYRAIERMPDDVELLTSMAEVDLHLSGPRPALTGLMMVLEKDPEYPPALFNIAMIYEKEFHSPPRAEAFYEKFLQVQPAGEYAATARARLESLRGYPAGSEEVAPIATPVDLNEPPPEPPVLPFKTVSELLAEAEALAMAGDTNGAMKLFRDAAAKADTDHDLKSHEEALQRAVKACPGEVETYFGLGAFLSQRSRFEEAFSVYAKAIDLGSPTEALLRAHADAALETRNLDAALVSLKRAVKLAPDRPDSLWDLARLYDEQMGMGPQAAAVYLEFQQKFPQDARVLKARTRAQELVPDAGSTSAGNPSVASNAPVSTGNAPATTTDQGRKLRIPRAPVKDSNKAVEAFNKGFFYQERGDWTRAIYYYRQALTHDHTYVEAYYNLGMVYRKSGDVDLALDAFEQALQYNPEKVDARYYLAMIRYEKKDPDQAVLQLNRVLKSNAQYAYAHYLLGKIHAEDPTGVSQAQHHYQKFMEIAPNDPLVGEVRAWMKSH